MLGRSKVAINENASSAALKTRKRRRSNAREGNLTLSRVKSILAWPRVSVRNTRDLVRENEKELLRGSRRRETKLASSLGGHSSSCWSPARTAAAKVCDPIPAHCARRFPTAQRESTSSIDDEIPVFRRDREREKRRNSAVRLPAAVSWIHATRYSTPPPSCSIRRGNPEGFLPAPGSINRRGDVEESNPPRKADLDYFRDFS